MKPEYVVYAFLVGVIILSLYFFQKKTKKKKEPPKNNEDEESQNTQTPATPTPAPSMVAKTKEMFGKKDVQIGVGIGFGLFVLLMGLFFLLKGDGLKTAAPYIFVPLSGLFSYFLSIKGRGYRSIPHSIVVMVVALFVITLWIHPELFRAVFEPYTNNFSSFRMMNDGGTKLYLAIFCLFVMICFFGYIIEAFAGMAFLLVLWWLV